MLHNIQAFSPKRDKIFKLNKNIQINYKKDFENNKGKMLGTDVTPEMARAHEMEPIRNKQKYQEQAKKDLVKTHVGPGKWGKIKFENFDIFIF